MKKRYIFLIAFILISLIPLSWAMWRVIDPYSARVFQVLAFPSRGAILSLGELGDPRASDALTSILLSDGADVSLRTAAAEAIGELRGPMAVFDLCSVVEDSRADTRVRGAAASALGKLGHPVAIAALKTLADDPTIDEAVRESAADALRKVGGDRPVAALVVVLKTDKDERMRCMAAYTLGEIGDAKAAEPLSAVLADKTTPAIVRHCAAVALGKLADPRAIKPLIAALADTGSDVVVRAEAAEVLGSLGDARAVKPLIAALKDYNWLVTESAAGALGKLGDPKAVEPLNAVVRDGDNPAQGAAILALIGFKDARVAEALIPILNSHYKGEAGPVIVLNTEPLVIALANQDDPRAVDTLIRALYGPGTPKSRIAAADALARIGDAKAIEPLTVVAGRASDPTAVREVAAKALRKLRHAGEVEEQP